MSADAWRDGYDAWLTREPSDYGPRECECTACESAFDVDATDPDPPTNCGMCEPCAKCGVPTQSDPSRDYDWFICHHCTSTVTPKKASHA